MAELLEGHNAEWPIEVWWLYERAQRGVGLRKDQNSRVWAGAGRDILKG